MTAPIQPQRFDREGAKRAGYSDAEIDAFLAEEDAAAKPKRPSVGSFSSESTKATRVAPEKGKIYANDPIALAREAAQGATFGLADEAEAAIRSIGSDRKYGEIRDDIRGQRNEYKRQNPVTSALVNAAGGLATGSAAMKGLSAIPKVGRMMQPGLTAGSRIGSAMAGGAVQGGLAGAASADGTMSDRAKGGAAGALIGGGMGGVLGLAAEALRGGRSVIRGVGDAYRGRNGAPIPVDADQAARETIPILERSGKSIGDLRALDRTADAPDNLAELIDGEYGKAGRSQLGTAHRYGLRPKVEEALVGRSREEAGRARQALERNGVRMVDDEAFAAEKLAEAQRNAGPLYDEALTGRNVTDPRLIDLIERPTGGAAYSEARKHMLDRGESMPSLEDAIYQSKPTPVRADASARPSGGRSTGAVPSVDELATMTPDQLRKYRSTKPVDMRSEADLLREQQYLQMMEAQDQAALSFRDNPVYAAREELGSRMAEDARGAVEESGMDVASYNRQNRDAGAAQRRVKARAPRLVAIADELEARAAASGAKAGPKPAGDLATSADALPESGGVLPTIPAKQVQRVKLALDDRLKDLEGKSGGTSTQRYRDLVQLRDEFDNLLYEHAPGYDKAQAAYAKPMQERDAFMSGRREGRTMTDADVPRMLSGAQKDYTARGVGSTIAEDVARLNDGTLGSVQNPAPLLAGNSKARARVNVATGGDAAKRADIERTASNIDRRFRTKNAVLGGSQTAERVADDLQELGGTVAANVAQGKFKSALDAILKPVNQVSRGASLDRRASLLLAMGDDRKKAIDLLEAARPLLLREAQKQTSRIGVTARLSGAATGRASSR